jgi:hypothetical protein
MAIVFADKVKVRSYSTGTAEFTLELVVPGFQSFAAIGVGNECYYGIEDAAGNWEVGLGTYDTDSTQELLFRNTVISSSNSNNLVNFPRGGKTVFVTIPSSVAANIIASTTFAFRDIAVAGQSTISADTTTDTLTLVAGTGIDITTNAGTDTITITADTGAIEFSGSTISTNDSSGIIIDQAVTLESNVTVGGDILPKTDNGGSLGSPSFQWKELFVSDGSVYIGNVKLSNVGGKLNVTTVINPGEDDEEEDPDDSDAASEIGGSNTGDITFTDDEIGSTTNVININASEFAQLQSGDNYIWVEQGVGAYIQVGSKTFEFDSRGALRLPADGDIINSSGQSVLSGGSYTPDDTDNWEDSEVNTIQAALDELAARMTAFENFEIDGGNAYTPAAGELLIDGNGA